jgi:methenyltetrahydrofolate cyclohydrolase
VTRADASCLHGPARPVHPGRPSAAWPPSRAREQRPIPGGRCYDQRVDDARPSLRDLTLEAFVDRLASAEPVPGGGSASAAAAALGAGLVSMVASLSLDRSRYAEHADLLAAWAERGRALASRLLELADEDAEAYAGFAAALKMPRETEAERAARTEALHGAARRSAEAPLRCVEACREVVEGAEALAGRSNVNAASDLAVAALLTEAASRGAAANVLVNLPATGDEALAADLSVRVDDLLRDIERLALGAREVVRAGIARPPILATGR